MTSELLLLIVLALVGLGIGSFLNVVVLRLNAAETLLGRSHCPHCKTTLPWYTLIPVGSYLALRGKCVFCKHPIALHYPAVEAVTAGLFVFTGLVLPADPMRLAFYLILIAICLAIFLSDYLFYTIPDALSLPGIAIAIIGQLLLGEDWWRVAVGVFVGGGVFALQYILSRGAWVGSGDIRFGAMLGAMLSWPNIFVALFIAYVVGALLVLPMLLVRKKGWKDTMPFGTFLAAAGMITLLFGDSIMHWYLYEATRLYIS